MKISKKLLTLALLPIGIIPLVTISCSGASKEVTYFESEGLRISSEGEIMGFVNENNIKNLTIKEEYEGVKIKSITKSAFANRQITSLNISNSVTSIGDNAFIDNAFTSDSVIVLPAKFNTLEERERIGINISKVTYFESEGLKISSEGKIMGFANENSNIESLTIKEEYEGVTIKSIAANAFIEKGILKLQLPSLITKIGDNAFSNNQLTSLILPNSITTIEGYAFRNNQLTSLTLPNSITTIGQGVFSNNQLTSLILPNSITTIERDAFRNNQLISLTFPNSITSIENGSFSNNKLISITLPNSITEIGYFAFYKNQLTSLIIPRSVTSIGDYAFSSNELTSLTLPNSITSIKNGAFSNNKLASLNIPNSVTSIGDDAFRLNNFTSDLEIVLPAKFNTSAERKRIGIIILEKLGIQNSKNFLLVEVNR